MSAPGLLLGIGSDGPCYFNVGVGFPDSHVDYPLSRIGAGLTNGQFAATTDGWVRFSVTMGAARTSKNTKYPRSELRELNRDGTLAGWDARTGRHALVLDLRVTAVPVRRPWVCVMQVHDAKSDLCRVQTEGAAPDELRLVVRNTPPGGEEVVTTVVPRYRLGDPLRARMEILDGVGEVWLAGFRAHLFDARAGGCYFKTGAYAQSNVKDWGERPDTLASVDIRAGSLRHWHTGWPAPMAPSAPAVAGRSTEARLGELERRVDRIEGLR